LILRDDSDDYDGDGNGDEGDGDDGSGDGNGDGGGDGGGGGGGDGDEDGDDYGDDDNEQVVSNEDVADGEDLDPYENFQLGRVSIVEKGIQTSPYDNFSQPSSHSSQCDTYQNLWMWDLSLSCESEFTLDSCNCTFAEELFGLGLLSCDDQEDCPSDCPICSTCLTLIGCEPPVGLLKGPKISTSVWLYIAGALVLLVILALALYHNRRRSQEENELKKNLMAGENEKEGFQASQDEKIQPWENPVDGEVGTSKAATLAAAGIAVKNKDEEDDSDSDSSVGSRTARTFDETVMQTSDDSTAPTIPTRDS
jgi:hypothetical protein